MAQYDPDHQQVWQVTSRSYAQNNFVPQTMMANGYDNNHVKKHVEQSDTFANDSNDKSMQHVARFRAKYASRRGMERMGNMRFVSRNDER
jgi:hypothetical protein